MVFRWEAVHANARARETPEGKKSAGRTGGIWGPGRRWGHTCNSVRGGKLLYVFGGYGTDNSQTNDVHVFDTVKQTWSKPMMKGIPPSPRDSHSCTTVGNRLFVFGGTDGNNPLSDLHILDTSSNSWIVPALKGKGPDAREGHSAALVDKRLFIFGGCGKSSDSVEEVYYNDVYILDTDTLVWERAMTYGIPPSPRDSHTCSSWNNKVVVLGGEDSSDCYLSDVHLLDADSLVWKQISTSGQICAPRAGHTTVAFQNKLFVFGGFTDARNLYDDLHVLDLNVDNGTWSRVVSVNQGPCARFSVAGDCLDEHKGIIVFIGGCNKSLEALDDMYYLHTDMPLENGCSETRQEKSSLRRELKKMRTENYLPAEEFEKNNVVHMPCVRSDSSQSAYLHVSSETGTKPGETSSVDEVTFEARVIDANQYGYTIETIISGKLLRGMLFPCTASSSQDNYDYLKKRKIESCNEGTGANEQQPILSTVPATPHERKNSDQEQTEREHAKESTPQVSPLEIFASNLTNISDACIYQPIKASENMEQPLPMSAEDMKSNSENMELSNMLSEDTKSGLKSSDPLRMPSDLKNGTENLDPSSMLIEDLHNDSEKLLPSSMPSEDLKNISEDLDPSSMLTGDLKNYEILDVLHKPSSDNLCENLDVQKEALPSSSCQGAEECSRSNYGVVRELEGKQNG